MIKRREYFYYYSRLQNKNRNKKDTFFFIFIIFIPQKQNEVKLNVSNLREQVEILVDEQDQNEDHFPQL